MPRVALLLLILWTRSAFCQTATKEPDTLQTLLAEVHQLRVAIEGMTVASQRVQIALYELQMQDGAVSRSAQRLDNVRAKCSTADEHRQAVATEIQREQTGLDSGAVPQTQIEVVRQRMTAMKSELETQTAQAQACRAGEAEASTQLRNDQAKLVELQDRIARLDKALEQLGSAAK